MPNQLPISEARLRSILAFVQSAEGLKDTLRTGITSQGRQESSAEHSWRLCLLACLFEDALADIDLLKLLKLCLVHDLGEAISGDVPAPAQKASDGRHARERRDMEMLCASLPPDISRGMLELWDEYAAGETPEALLAKGFDKIETMLQHLLGPNSADFGYEFNLSYGKSATDRHPLLRELRVIVDEATRQKLEERATAGHMSQG